MTPSLLLFNDCFASGELMSVLFRQRYGVRLPYQTQVKQLAEPDQRSTPVTKCVQIAFRDEGKMRDMHLNQDEGKMKGLRTYTKLDLACSDG